MGASTEIKPPPGFELEEPKDSISTANLPSGFELETPPEPMSKALSFAHGAGQGATLGWGDEGAATLQTMVKASKNLFGGKISPEDLLKFYQKSRDTYRGGDLAAKEANPKTYMGGEFAGGMVPMLAPGMQEATIAKMAALGAMQGLGGSEADLTKGDWQGAARDTAIGGAIGAGTGVLAKGASAVLDPEAWQSLAQSRAAKALGFTKRFLNSPEKLARSKQVAQTMLDEGVISPMAGAEDLSDRVTSLKGKSGSAIGDFLKSLGHGGLDPEQAIAEIDTLRPQYRGGDYDTVHAALDRAIDTIKAHGDGPIPWEEANKLKGILQDAAKFNANSDNLTTGARRMAAGKFRGTLDQSLEDVAKNPNVLNTVEVPGGPGDIAGGGKVVRALTPEEGAAKFDDFLGNKKIYGAASDAEDALANRLSSEQGNKSIGLTDMIAAGSEIASGSPGAAAGILGAKRAAERFGNTSTAWTANKIAGGMEGASKWIGDKIPELLKSNPQALGRYAPLLAKAMATGGAAAVSVRHFVLMNNDPEYRQHIRDMQDQTDNQ